MDDRRPVAAARRLLGALPGRPGLVGALGAVHRLAVPEAARAVVVAGLTELSRRRPVVVAVPAGGRCRTPGPRPGRVPRIPTSVELFPAWETLPFERVSPSVETMGRRLRTMWRLRTGDADAVASWWPRPAPWCSGSARTSRTSSRS